MGGIKGLLPTIVSFLTGFINTNKLVPKVDQIWGVFHQQQALAEDQEMRNQARSELANSLMPANATQDVRRTIENYSALVQRFNETQDTMTDYERQRQQVIIENIGKRLQEVQALENQRQVLQDIIRLSGISARTENNLFNAAGIIQTGRDFLDTVSEGERAARLERQSIFAARFEHANAMLGTLPEDVNAQLRNLFTQYTDQPGGPGGFDRQNHIAQQISDFIRERTNEIAEAVATDIANTNRRNGRTASVDATTNGTATPAQTVGNISTLTAETVNANFNNLTINTLQAQSVTTQQGVSTTAQTTVATSTPPQENTPNPPAYSQEQIDNALRVLGITRDQLNAYHDIDEMLRQLTERQHEWTDAQARHAAQQRGLMNMQYGVQMISSLTAAGTALQALMDNIKDSQATFSNVTGSITSMFMNVARMGSSVTRWAAQYSSALDAVRAGGRAVTASQEALSSVLQLVSKHFLLVIGVVGGAIVAFKVLQ